MNLKEQISADFLSAYKAHEEAKVSVLRMLKSAIQNAEIANKGEITDEDIISILKKEIKQRTDTMETYQKAGETEKAEAEKNEIDLIQAYLPAQLDENALEKIIEQAITDLGATGPSSMGQVIGKVMKEHGSEADGGMVSKIVRDKLQNS